MQSPSSSDSHSIRYLSLTILSFIIFAAVTIYWSFLKHIDSYYILFHRCIWTFLSLLLIVLLRKKEQSLLQFFKKSGVFFCLSAASLATNWFTYIYAVNQGHFFEASLAYFISPLFSVAFGCLFFKETLRKKQIVAILIALMAIIYLLISKGTIPKYALVIGVSFSLYGLLSRKIHSSAFMRLMLESLIIVVVLLILQSPLDFFRHFISQDVETQWLLVGCGAVTTIPLLMYIACVKKVKFSTIGILSFLLPTLIFLMGILYFKESLDKEKLLAILLIWMSVGLYIYDLLAPAKKTIS